MKLRSGKEYSFNVKTKRKNNYFRITPKMYTYILVAYLISMLILGNYLLYQKHVDKYVSKSYEHLSNISTKYFEIFSKFIFKQTENGLIILDNVYKQMYLKYLEFKMRNVNISYDYFKELNHYNDDYNDVYIYTNITHSRY